MFDLGRQIIPPEFPLDRKERREVLRIAWQRWMKVKLNVVLYTLVIVATLTICLLLLPELIDRLVGAHTWWSTLIGFVAYFVGLLVSISVLQKLRFAPCVYTELRVRGFDVCRRCGYWLQGLEESERRCPECGTSRNRPATL